MSHRNFIESSAVTTAFWLDQYGGRFASIFRRCPPSIYWGQWIKHAKAYYDYRHISEYYDKLIPGGVLKFELGTYVLPGVSTTTL